MCSVTGNLQVVNGGVPTYVVPALFNVNVLKTCNIDDRMAHDPDKWIDEFIQARS